MSPSEKNHSTWYIYTAEYESVAWLMHGAHEREKREEREREERRGIERESEKRERRGKKH